jgi:putative ABC transport system ATP-binding protein
MNPTPAAPEREQGSWAQEPAIVLRHVSKVYGTGPLAVEALRDIELSVNPGEFLMLVGPSGSGKTTLVSVIGCVLQPTSGEVSIFGERIDHRTEAELPLLRLHFVGFIFQGFNLLPALSARDNVALPLRLRGWTRDDATREADATLGEVGLGSKVHRKPGDLSGGEKQRVAIARAIAGRPPLILADEPTASLDARVGHQVTEMLRDLSHERGHTVLVVTHDNRIFHLADRVVHIEDGRIVEAEDATPTLH